MNPLSRTSLFEIARSLEGYRSYVEIDLSEGNPSAEIAWIPSEDILMSGEGYLFYYETVEQARSLREVLGASGFTNCRATSNGLPVTFVLTRSIQCKAALRKNIGRYDKELKGVS